LARRQDVIVGRSLPPPVTAKRAQAFASSPSQEIPPTMIPPAGGRERQAPPYERVWAFVGAGDRHWVRARDREEASSSPTVVFSAMVVSDRCRISRSTVGLASLYVRMR